MLSFRDCSLIVDPLNSDLFEEVAVVSDLLLADVS